jgi:hypothetical protein
MLRLQDLLRTSSTREVVTALVKRDDILNDCWKFKTYNPHVSKLKTYYSIKKVTIPLKRFIAQGYRDKGTLPSSQERARKKANTEALIYLGNLPSSLRVSLEEFSLGGWIDPSTLPGSLKVTLKHLLGELLDK